MPYVLFHAGLFDGQNRADSEDTILWLLEVLTDRNCRYLKAHPDTPKLYDSGVVYELPDQIKNRPINPWKLKELAEFLRDKLKSDDETVDIVLNLLQGIEIFRDIPTVLTKRKVDCDNLSAFRCAELRMAGIKATPYITWRETPGGTTYHALVRWPDGSSEDPSILLGMGGEEKDQERAEERRKNRERFDTLVEEARKLCNQGVTTPGAVAQTISALGLLPKSGSW